MKNSIADEANGIFKEMMESGGDFLNEMIRFRELDSRISDEERLSPDSFGCDRLFLEHFITERMEEDFPLIARDFFMHEYDSLSDYEDVEYLSIDSGDEWPSLMFNRFTLSLMMNALNGGSEYTKSLLLHLYKVYYKKEYKVLKRFSTLSAGELLSLAKPEDGYSFYSQNLARILFIAKLSGIKISADCNYIYAFLNDHSELIDDREPYSLSSVFGENYLKCLKEVEGMMDINKWYSLEVKASRFLENSLKMMGYSPDYVDLCDDEEQGLTERLAHALAVFKKTYPNKEYTPEDIILYGIILHAVRAIACNSYWMSDTLKVIAFGERATDFYGHFPALFDPEEVVVANKLKEKDSPKENKKPEVHAEEDAPRYNETALINEMDVLRRKVHKLENDNKGLRTELSEKKSIIDENRDIAKRLDDATCELAALRSYVYNLTEDEEPVKGVSLDEMKSTIARRRIVLIGGHANWVAKMKKEFGEWVFVSPSASGTLEADVVNRADKVYFFTHTISHSTYYKYMNVVRERKIDFGYIHGVNIEKNIRQIYREMIC